MDSLLFHDPSTMNILSDETVPPSHRDSSVLSDFNPQRWSSDEDEMDIDETEQDTPTRRRYTPRTEESLSTAEKLQSVVSLLHTLHWSFAAFLKAWVGAAAGSSGVNIQHHLYRTVAQRQRVLATTISALNEDGFVTIDGWENWVRDCRLELQLLGQQQYFNNDFVNVDLDKIDFSKAVDVIKRFAPTWFNILRSALQNQRAHRSSYHQGKADIVALRILTITYIACFSIAKKTSSFFPSAVGLYLTTSGTKRRAIETLSGLGICHSYHQNLLNLGKKAEQAEVVLPLLFIIFETSPNSFVVLRTPYPKPIGLQVM